MDNTKSEHWSGIVSDQHTMARYWLQMLGLGHVCEQTQVEEGVLVWHPPIGAPVPLFVIDNGIPPPPTADNLSLALAAMTTYREAKDLPPVAAYAQATKDMGQLKLLGETLGTRLMVAVGLLHGLFDTEKDPCEWGDVLALLSGPLDQKQAEAIGRAFAPGVQPSDTGEDGVGDPGLYRTLKQLHDEGVEALARAQRTVQEPTPDVPIDICGMADCINPAIPGLIAFAMGCSEEIPVCQSCRDDPFAVKETNADDKPEQQ